MVSKQEFTYAPDLRIGDRLAVGGIIRGIATGVNLLGTATWTIYVNVGNGLPDAKLYLSSNQGAVVEKD